MSTLVTVQPPMRRRFITLTTASHPASASLCGAACAQWSPCSESGPRCGLPCAVPAPRSGLHVRAHLPGASSQVKPALEGLCHCPPATSRRRPSHTASYEGRAQDPAHPPPHLPRAAHPRRPRGSCAAVSVNGKARRPTEKPAAARSRTAAGKRRISAGRFELVAPVGRLLSCGLRCVPRHTVEHEMDLQGRSGRWGPDPTFDTCVCNYNTYSIRLETN